MEIPVIAPLRKIRDTRSQMELSGELRRKNLKGAFVSRPGNWPRRLLLIDDVFTTGSTLSECARALKQSGVESVLALTLARAPLSDHTEKSHED